MQDVIIASGGSGALEIAISCLVDEGDALLVPRPGFALYQVGGRWAGSVCVMHVGHAVCRSHGAYLLPSPDPPPLQHILTTPDR